MACVAHALVMTCLAKNTFPKYSDSPTAARSSCSLRHLKRKISPYTGLQKHTFSYPCVHSFHKHNDQVSQELHVIIAEALGFIQQHASETELDTGPDGLQ